ncbi:hypothetical protein [Caulobacter sp.]|uniref:hypothetical protein n=1 Tax=Caulobacter sp. TaxID=78 RepID=UPI002B479F84|nr:hypothetical protein [Caulobacter sp.]HJV40082.1 hypothetical protein [Caulobacter sp.]
MKPFTLAVVAAITLSLPAMSTADPAPRAQPSATAHLSGDSIALGVGYGWGRGVLSFQGRNTPFTLTGVTLVGAGAERAEGEAKIYNLKRLEDFPGLYMVAGASGSFVTLGGGTAVLRNAKGVEIRLRGETRGFHIAVAAGGVNIALR